MRSLKLALAALSLGAAFAAPSLAHATIPVVPLSFVGTTLQDTTFDSVSGDIVFGLGSVVGADFTIDGVTFLGMGTETTPGGVVDIVWTGAGGSSFDLYLPVSTLSGYMGGNICSVDYTTNCNGNISSFSDPTDVLAGSLQPADTSATPEPSSLLLFGTGILGIAGAARRRFSRR